MANYSFEDLEKKALEYRRKVLTLIHKAGSGHPGGSLSAVEIFVTLYHSVMRHYPLDPKSVERDRLVVSKGHISPIVYVTLADLGYFQVEELQRFRRLNGILQGHVYRDVPGVEFSTGSLGQGLSVANGIALAAKILDKDYNVFCVLGDGELQEGSIWEAAMSAAQLKLGNVCAIVDRNMVQENGPTEEIMQEEPLGQKWNSFGWRVKEVDGHDIRALLNAFDEFKQTQDSPFIIIAKTIKGKGVSFMEGQSKWHGKAPDAQQLESALWELDFKR